MKVFQFIFGPIFVLFLQEVGYVFSQGKVNLVPQIYGKTTSIDCDANPKYIANLTCKLKAINWERTVANMDGDVVGIIRNTTVRFQAFKYTNQYRPYLVDVTLNICDIMKNGRTNAYFKAIYKSILKFTNINHTCPYTGHLTMRGAYMDFNLIQFAVPSGKYKFDFNFYEGWPLELTAKGVYKVSVEKRTNVKRTS